MKLHKYQVTEISKTSLDEYIHEFISLAKKLMQILKKMFMEKGMEQNAIKVPRP